MSKLQKTIETLENLRILHDTIDDHSINSLHRCMHFLGKDARRSLKEIRKLLGDEDRALDVNKWGWTTEKEDNG